MAFGIKSYGQSWILQNDVDNTTVNVSLYDTAEDPSFTDDQLAYYNVNSNINPASISMSTSSESGVYDFSSTNVDVDVSGVNSVEYVDAYVIYISGNVILSGGLSTGTKVNIRDIDTFTINEVGGSFL